MKGKENTLQRVDNQINVAGHQEFFQFLSPQILGGEFPESYRCVPITCCLPRMDLECIIGPSLLERRGNQISLRKSKFRAASSYREGFSRRGVGGSRRGRCHCGG